MLDAKVTISLLETIIKQLGDGTLEVRGQHIHFGHTRNIPSGQVQVNLDFYHAGSDKLPVQYELFEAARPTHGGVK